MTDPLLDAALKGTTRETLLRAGVRAVERRAGWKPQPVEAPEPAPEEKLRPCSLRAGVTIAMLFEVDEDVLLQEAAALLRKSKQRLRPELLPLALARKDEAFRETLGERGPWLAKMRADWSWASDVQPSIDAQQIWTEGAYAERLALLKRTRDLPLLLTTWKSEKAEHRAEFLDALEPRDEEFLERALDDRAQAVRQAAARWLAVLDGSRFQQRMQERAAKLVQKRGLVQRLVSGKLELSLPAELDAAWERDGVPRTPPQGIGAKAFWSMRTIALVPPKFWETHLALTPQQIAKAAPEEMVAGLHQAALLFADARWAAAIFDVTKSAELLPLLTPQDLDARAGVLLESQGSLRLLPTPWSDAISRAVIAANNFAAAQFVAARISRNTFELLEESLPKLVDPPALQRQVDAARETLRIRRTLHEEIHP